MASSTRKFTVASNPHRSTSSRPPAAKKGSIMAKTPQKKKNAAGHSKKTGRRPNTTRRRRHNPGELARTIGSTQDVVTGSVAGLVSAVATRQIPQMILNTGNTGVEGYAANLATALVTTWAAGKFAGPAAGRGALIGGMVILLDRVVSDNVSPISSYLSLSGVGDHRAYSKLGTIRTGYYTRPSLLNPDGSMYVPDPYTNAAVNAITATYPQITQPMPAGGRVGAVNPSSLRRHAANGMMLSSRFQTRFNQ
jgi:hypothetical protein